MKSFSSILIALFLAFSTETFAADDQSGSSSTQDQSATEFSRVDKDGNGVIDHKEAKAAGIDQQEFKIADRNGDGKITKDEYYKKGSQ